MQVLGGGDGVVPEYCVSEENTDFCGLYRNGVCTARVHVEACSCMKLISIFIKLII